MDMRKIWRGFAAAAAGAAALLSLSGCAVGQPETAMDTYHYDGYLNAQWGSAPDEVANQLQLDRTQWVRLEEDQLAGMPEGSQEWVPPLAQRGCRGGPAATRSPGRR